MKQLERGECVEGKGESNNRAITKLDKWKDRNVEEGVMYFQVFVLV